MTPQLEGMPQREIWETSFSTTEITLHLTVSDTVHLLYLIQVEYRKDSLQNGDLNQRHELGLRDSLSELARNI